MTGDGLTDLVRVRNGEICYWPNLGYGRFGAKVDDGRRAAGSTTPTSSTRSRIRLADIDGSGTTDIDLPAPRRAADLYFNQSGNAWTAPHDHRRLPARSTTLASVTVDRSARQRHRLPGVVLAAARRRRRADALRRPDGRRQAAPADRECVNNLGAETRDQLRAVDQVLPARQAPPARRG